MKSVVEMLDWGKSPLIPAIIQDIHTKQILMLAFMNKEALQLTLETKQMYYFSRSKQRIWKKGESSGHTQALKQCFIDCDNDSLLFIVEQQGVACHTGSKTCFFRKLNITNSKNKGIKKPNALIKQHTNDKITTPLYSTIDILYHALLERKHRSSKASYTALLYEKGENAIGKKIIEEAGEVVMALKDRSEKEIIYECADLLYHTLVGLAFCNIHPERVISEINSRFGISGIEEKNKRG